MINVLNEQGLAFQINVNRFFEVNNNQYLIYNTNEKDESGYVKLYLAKNANGFFVKVEDDIEWNAVKDLIKIIVKEVNENQLMSVSDLDYNRIENQTIISARAFKLSEQVSSMLSANKKLFETIDSVITTEMNNIEKTIEEIKPFSLESDYGDEPKSYEELLAQIKGFKEEISKEDVLEQQTEIKEQAKEELVDNVVDAKFNEVISNEPKTSARIDALEILLGQGKVEEQRDETLEEKKVVETLNEEEPKRVMESILPNNINLEERVKQLEEKIEQYEIKLSKIKDILN